MKPIPLHPHPTQLNTTRELLEDIRAGRMVVLMDDEDRENEGDLIIAAERVRAEDINFMAQYGRGLICLTLTRERCRQLRLPLMVSDTNAEHRTNFTVSIEAAEGVTTGISAHDRAHTIRTAVRRDAPAVAEAQVPRQELGLHCRSDLELALELRLARPLAHQPAGLERDRRLVEQAAQELKLLRAERELTRRAGEQHDAVKLGGFRDTLNFRRQSAEFVVQRGTLSRRIHTVGRLFGKFRHPGKN